MSLPARLRSAGAAVALLALLCTAAAQAQERPALALVEAGSERLVVAWTWPGEDDPAAFSVHWRRRVGGAGRESAQIEGAARRFEITGLRPLSAYIVRVRPLDVEGNRIRDADGRSLDLRGVFDTTRSPALPAPIPGDGAGHVMYGFAQSWKRSEAGISAAGGEHEMMMVMRWKEPDANEWTYSAIREGAYQVSFDVVFDKPTERIFIQAAELREISETETPEALNWSEMIDYRLQTAPKNLRAIATHDTLKIEWDVQLFSAASTEYPVSVMGPDGSVGVVVPAEPIASGEPNRIVFSGLPPDAKFTIRVDTTRNPESGLTTHITTRTKPAPDGYIPIPRGPQNLTAFATPGSITLEWSPPYTGANEVYVVALRDEHGTLIAGDVLWAIPETGASFTFRGLRPSTEYSASVSHRGIVEASAVLTVATPSRGRDSPGTGASGRQGIPEPGDPFLAIALSPPESEAPWQRAWNLQARRFSVAAGQRGDQPDPVRPRRCAAAEHRGHPSPAESRAGLDRGCLPRGVRRPEAGGAAFTRIGNNGIGRFVESWACMYTRSAC